MFISCLSCIIGICSIAALPEGNPPRIMETSSDSCVLGKPSGPRLATEVIGIVSRWCPPVIN